MVGDALRFCHVCALIMAASPVAFAYLRAGFAEESCGLIIRLRFKGICAKPLLRAPFCGQFVRELSAGFGGGFIAPRAQIFQALIAFFLISCAFIVCARLKFGNGGWRLALLSCVRVDNGRAACGVCIFARGVYQKQGCM